MAKLAPPIIQGTVPAFYGTELKVPFGMNRAVSSISVKGFKLRIKTISSNYYFGECEITTNISEIISNSQIIFDCSSFSDKLNEGQFYKIQVAYIGTDGDGYFSAVSTVKYVSEPSICIEGLWSSAMNNKRYGYVGQYSLDGCTDTSERVYQYQFLLYDNNNQILEDSGWRLHNADNELENSIQFDTYNCKYDIAKDESCYIQYSVITVNGLEVSTPRYLITQTLSMPIDFTVSVYCELNYNNGYIDIYLQNKDSVSIGNGNFVVQRADDSSDFKQWETLSRFNLNNIDLSQPYSVFRDFTFEHGKYYKYCIMKYNPYNFYTDRIESQIIYGDFEDAFLYDGNKQLKIRYNPKVSSFKTAVLETKVEAIGNQYPFFVRSGNTYYKDFPISGLISYLGDEEELFMTDEELGFESRWNRVGTISELDEIETHGRTTNLVNYNLYAERLFKIQVLEWLNNGESKLYRSPTEGNYIVRLMNVNLQPNDAVGRMLHTFSCNAYEVGEYNVESLENINIINSSDIKKPEAETIIDTITIDDFQVLENGKVVFNDYALMGLDLQDMAPGSEISFCANGGTAQTYIIGSTGTYHLDSDISVTNLTLNTAQANNITIQVKHEQQEKVNEFNSIVEASSVDFAPVIQYFGNIGDNIYHNGNKILSTQNLIQLLTGAIAEDGTYIESPKIKISQVYFKFYKILSDEEAGDAIVTINDNPIILKDNTYLDYYLSVDDLKDASIFVNSNVMVEIHQSGTVVKYSIEDTDSELLAITDKNSYEFLSKLIQKLNYKGA